jgi:hypothetical protein
VRLDLPWRTYEQLRAIGEKLTMLFAVEQVALIGKLTTTVRTGVRRGTSLALQHNTLLMACCLTPKAHLITRRASIALNGKQRQ